MDGALLFMHALGYQWMAACAHGRLWIPIDRHWCLWRLIDTNGWLLVVVDRHLCLWRHIDICGCQWKYTSISY